MAEDFLEGLDPQSITDVEREYARIRRNNVLDLPLDSAPRALLDEITDRIDVAVEDAFHSTERAAMALAELSHLELERRICEKFHQTQVILIYENGHDPQSALQLTEEGFRRGIDKTSMEDTSKARCQLILDQCAKGYRDLYGLEPT